MIEDLINAFKNFRRNRIRTMLSLLGIIIGVAAVIVIMSIGKSSTKKIEETFGSCGLDMVSINQGFFRKKINAVKIEFDQQFRENLFDGVKGIKKIWYKKDMSSTVTYLDSSAQCSCVAVEYGYIDAYGFNFESGKDFELTDDVMGLQKIILGNSVATSLFPNGDAVGKNVILVTGKVSFNFVVCGVLKEQNSGMENSSSSCYVPMGFYTKNINPNSSASSVMVQAETQSKAKELVNVINDYCLGLSGTEGSVSVSSMTTMIDQMSSITKTMSVMLAAIAAISLLVGGIGIMNIMIVTVTERKQEIGIRKALGASPALIRRQFLIESAAVTVTGGIIGIILGIGLSIAVEYVQSNAIVVSIPSCIIAFVFSVFVGIFFGLSPASRAAKLDPVAALSGE